MVTPQLKRIKVLSVFVVANLSAHFINAFVFSGTYTSRVMTGLVSRFVAPLENQSHRITSLNYSPFSHDVLVSYSAENVYLFNTQVSVCACVCVCVSVCVCVRTYSNSLIFCRFPAFGHEFSDKKNFFSSHWLIHQDIHLWIEYTAYQYALI